MLRLEGANDADVAGNTDDDEDEDDEEEDDDDASDDNELGGSGAGTGTATVFKIRPPPREAAGIDVDKCHWQSTVASMA